MAEYNNKPVNSDFDGHNIPLHKLSYYERLNVLSEVTEWIKMLQRSRNGIKRRKSSANSTKIGI